MNLIIDIGNTRAKLALFKEDELILIDSHDAVKIDRLERLFIQHNIEHVISCSVRHQDELVNTWISDRANYLVLSSKTDVPIKNNYGTPDTLGFDRLASVVEANKKFPGRHALCIDIGTCITYDFIDKSGTYFGGGIAPGIDLRFKAMHNFTKKLPLVYLESMENHVALIGSTTEESMQSGVVNGIASEIDGTIMRYSDENEDLITILTGGHSTFFESYVKSKIFAFPNLVLYGLNTILRYNAN